MSDHQPAPVYYSRNKYPIIPRGYSPYTALADAGANLFNRAGNMTFGHY